MADTLQTYPASRRVSELRHLKTLPRVSGVRVLWALVLTFVVMPFLEELEFGQFAESALLTLVLGSAVLAVGADRKSMFWTIFCATPALAAKWVNLARPGLVAPEVSLLGAMMCVGYVTWRFLRFITAARRVDTNVLCSGVAAFLMLALAWAFAYSLIDHWIPGSFAGTFAAEPGKRMAGFTSLYFSLITLCTVGFGDIVPVSGPARMLAMFEGMAGVFFVAVMVSRLVSLYGQPAKEEPARSQE